jgi:hypothetical protein
MVAPVFKSTEDNGFMVAPAYRGQIYADKELRDKMYLPPAV